jgi:tetratricopeptide (TPR) repeat protein
VKAALKGCATGFLLVVAVLVTQPFRAAVPIHAQGLGRVDFPTSGSANAQPHFLRGVQALHNFEYDAAVQAFRRAREVDASFALAYWGEALAHHSVLSSSSDVEAARGVLRELGATRAARLARAGSDRERGFLEGVEALFGDGSDDDRQRAYVEAMKRLHERYPDDNEAAAFYVLALLDTAIRATFGLSDSRPGEGHQHYQLAGSDTQRQAGEILRRVLQRNPEHPGAAHYLLHNYDDAAHAAQALDVARTYARIAPESSHARHMPAHIFVQLGLWSDAATSDESASRAAEAAAKRLDPRSAEAQTDYHPLTWLQYERLQLGQIRRAREMVESMRAAAGRTSSDLLKSHAASMRARFVVEARRWELLRDGDDFGNLDELLAIGISAARSGNLGRADQVRELFGRLAAGGGPSAMAPALTVMEREVAALVHLAAGRSNEAIDALRTAVEAERKLPTGMGPPRPIKPAGELLGEVLLELGRAPEAREAFEQSLQRYPNRSASVLGTARAAVAAGDRALAERHYSALLVNWREADADLADLAEAQAKGRRSFFSWILQKKVTVPFFVVAVTAAVFVLRRRKAPVSAPRTARPAKPSRKRSGR